METFVKRYLWTLNVLVVALAGVVVARTVSALAVVRLAEPPSIDSPDDGRRRAVRPVTATVSDESLARMFGVALPDAAPPTPAEPTEPVDTGEEVASSLNATLVATIEAEPEQYSVAVITDNNARDTGVYGIGDRLMGSAKVIKIETRRVLVLNNGRREYLEMDAEGEGKSRPVAAATSSVQKKDEDEGEGESSIRKVSENEYVVAKDEIESTLNNLNTIATQARIVPAFKNGVAQGFKLFSIRPGSIYAKIGIQNGDVVKRINGYEINSPDKALEVYQKLKDSREVTVELERRGRAVKKTYTIE